MAELTNRRRTAIELAGLGFRINHRHRCVGKTVVTKRVQHPHADLINELVSKGTKIIPPNVVTATRMPDGNIAFLERGNSKSGLQHIVERHAAEFAQAGIPESKIPDFLMQVLKNGKVVGQQSRRGGRPIYEVSYEGKTLRVAITVGSNGTIVGANMR